MIEMNYQLLFIVKYKLQQHNLHVTLAFQLLKHWLSCNSVGHINDITLNFQSCSLKLSYTCGPHLKTAKCGRPHSFYRS